MSTLPPHTIRLSAKAKRPILRVLPGKGLEVVLPHGVKESIVPLVLERHREWIERTLARVCATQQVGEPEAFPFSFCIRGRTETIALRFSGRNARLHELEPGLFIPPEGAEILPCRELALPPFLGDPRERPTGAFRRLRDALREDAAQLLCAVLEKEARDYDFPCRPGRIRFQKSRWGSCSARGEINLNAALIFLPDRLIRHVLLHEL